MSGATAPPIEPARRIDAAHEAQRRRQPRYNVVLWDDNDHTYPYVIRMLRQLFAHSFEQAYKMATQVDHNGRVICLTTTKEHAELKRDQIRAFGRDHSLASCKGSMFATIEAVE